MLNAFSSVARARVSSPASRSRLTRSSSRVTRPPRTAINALLNAETGSPTALAQAPITVNGFVRSLRKQKRVAFAAIGDGSSLEPLQAVLSPEQANGCVQSAKRLRSFCGSAPADTTWYRLAPGIAVSLTGSWAASPAGKEQSHELQVQQVQILGENDASVCLPSRPFEARNRTDRVIMLPELSNPKQVPHCRLPTHATTP